MQELFLVFIAGSQFCPLDNGWNDLNKKVNSKTMLESDKIWEPWEMQHWVGKNPWMVLPTLDDRNWYPVSYECGSGRCLRWFDGIFAAFEIADVSFSGWWKSYIQRVDKSQNYLNMANVPQCSKIENQENGREFEIGIIGNVAQQHDAGTWWFVIYKRVLDNMFVDMILYDCRI